MLDHVRAFRFSPDAWLWCARCGRFFQGRDALPDRLGGEQGCADAACDGAGYYVDILDWDAWPGDDPVLLARWPAPHELRRGLVAPPWLEGERDDVSCLEDDLTAETAVRAAEGWRW